MKRSLQDYASDGAAVLDDLAAVWTKLMNADRFDGPVSNACSTSKAAVKEQHMII